MGYCLIASQLEKLSSIGVSGFRGTLTKLKIQLVEVGSFGISGSSIKNYGLSPHNFLWTLDRVGCCWMLTIDCRLQKLGGFV